MLTAWKSELVITGYVKKSGEVLSLWFIPDEGDGTLGRGGDRQPYTLEDVTLGQDFHEDLRAELAAIALAAVAPFAERESHGRFLEMGLRDAADKLGALLAASTIEQPQRRRALRMAHAIALLAIGERESGTEGLQQAGVAFRAALEEINRGQESLVWAKTQNYLGTVLRILGTRELGHGALATGGDGLLRCPRSPHS